MAPRLKTNLISVPYKHDDLGADCKGNSSYRRCRSSREIHEISSLRKAAGKGQILMLSQPVKVELSDV